MPTPSQPKIYHIVHVDKLASIVADDCLWSDAVMVTRPSGTLIGMNRIKARRLTLPVSCHQGTKVGEYVPFYFCPRSIMLYVIHCANDADLTYRGGQQPIIHLEADLQRVVQWAQANDRCWAFSLSNAGAAYTQFGVGMERLKEINWEAVAATDFRQPDIKEAKQAEFLVQRSFPWHLIERIGVSSQEIVARVSEAMHTATHRPRIEIRKDWYY